MFTPRFPTTKRKLNVISKTQPPTFANNKIILIIMERAMTQTLIHPSWMHFRLHLANRINAPPNVRGVTLFAVSKATRINRNIPL